MSPCVLSLAIFFCLTIAWTWALPKRPFSNGASSGAGEIPDEFPQDHRPFDESLGKGSPGKEVFDDYDLDEGPRIFPEDYENEIHPEPQPQDGGSERPLKPDDRIPEVEHPEDGHREEEEDHELPPHEKPKGGEETHEDEEKEEEEVGTKGSEEEPHGSEGEDTRGVEDETKPDGGEGETKEDEGEIQAGEEEFPLPFKPAVFSFQQVNHYIKELEKAMEHVFKDSLEEASLLNNTFANNTEEEVEMDGHKYKVHKSIIKTGDEDKNSTLLIEAVSSVKEDEQKKNKTKRSNPDAEPNQ